MTKALTKGILGDYRQRPIVQKVAMAERARHGYRAYPISLDAPENREKLVDLRAQGIQGANHYAIAHNPPYYQKIPGAIPELLARASLVKRLCGVNRLLAPYGLLLWIYDAWRPQAVQNYFHDHWMPAYLQEQEPSLKGEALTEAVEKYWSKGAQGAIDPLSPPPHSTGAAVDLTLKTEGGESLFMGTIFDDVTKASNTAYFEDPKRCSLSDIEARDNRRMLYWVMAEAGFANNPTEWWHFSRGDQMWAKITGAPAAYYSVVFP